MDMDTVPSGIYRYDYKPAFVTWPKTNGEWHIWGPEDLCVPGTVVQVEKYSEPGVTDYFEILDHVAERVVRKQNGMRVRFVMCTFDRTVTEEPVSQALVALEKKHRELCTDPECWCK